MAQLCRLGVVFADFKGESLARFSWGDATPTPFFDLDGDRICRGIDVCVEPFW
ncbi:hypothetical protein JJD41_13490 [Oxynema sp. CENA135]|uniref:hypothetical protein n=1 Tax=Oxynema sp. CENA135 TaxID=984206 RepID=UPI00190A3F5E|nr:hypothetical protein [Oxynema sp. CENA135]MBK4730865.1 hypothetical protein [Oxynema sp. CENA135]